MYVPRPLYYESGVTAKRFPKLPRPDEICSPFKTKGFEIHHIAAILHTDRVDAGCVGLRRRLVARLAGELDVKEPAPLGWLSLFWNNVDPGLVWAASDPVSVRPAVACLGED